MCALKGIERFRAPRLPLALQSDAMQSNDVSSISSCRTRGALLIKVKRGVGNQSCRKQIDLHIRSRRQGLGFALGSAPFFSTHPFFSPVALPRLSAPPTLVVSPSTSPSPSPSRRLKCSLKLHEKISRSTRRAYLLRNREHLAAASRSSRPSSAGAMPTVVTRTSSPARLLSTLVSPRPLA